MVVVGVLIARALSEAGIEKFGDLRKCEAGFTGLLFGLAGALGFARLPT